MSSGRTEGNPRDVNNHPMERTQVQHTYSNRLPRRVVQAKQDSADWRKSSVSHMRGKLHISLMKE